jgi:hypothetical protein
MTKEQRKQRVKSIYQDVTSAQIDLISGALRNKLEADASMAMNMDLTDDELYSAAIAKVREVLLHRLVELNYFTDINISKH